MRDDHITSMAQLKEFTKLSNSAVFKSNDKHEMYTWVGTTLGKFRYFRLKKKDKTILRKYIKSMVGISHSQLTRLIAQKRKSGRVSVKQVKRHSFSRVYSTSDIARLIETDNAHSRLSGKATKRIFQRQYELFGDKAYERIKDISVSHIYNLRERRQYQSHARIFSKTKPTAVAIGERTKPSPEGSPGFIRVDTVHQGDMEGDKGVYHINLVDEVTQWEIVGAVPRISEHFLAPLLKDALKQFPYRIINFHSDNGSEYINKVVAKLLNKLLIRQTKSRARRTNDNALVEGKNGAIVRKHMGYIHIPQKHAPKINTFYRNYFNPYLNYHRPCGFATITTDKRGKEKKVYNTYLTPFEKFMSLPKREQYLKDNMSIEKLEEFAYAIDDNESAELMQNAKSKLFNSFKSR